VVDTNFTHNCFSPTNKTIQIVFSKVLTTYTICGFIHSNSSVNYIYTFFLLQLSFLYFLDFILYLIIKTYDQSFMIHLENTIVSE